METKSSASLFPETESDQLKVIQHLKTLKLGSPGIENWNQVDQALQEYAYLRNIVAKLQEKKHQEQARVEEEYGKSIEKFLTVMDLIDEMSHTFCKNHSDQFTFTTNGNINVEKGDKTLPHGSIILVRETKIKMKPSHEQK